MYICYTKLFSIEQIIYIKMDLALNNLQRLICHKIKQNKPNNIDILKSECIKVAQNHPKYHLNPIFDPLDRTLTVTTTSFQKPSRIWRQHPTRHQLYGHLPPITKTIQVRRTRHAGHGWRSRDELISDVLLCTPTYGRVKAGRPARTYM